MAGRLIGGSVSFDGAAETYDATRALPDDVARKLTGALLDEIEAAAANQVLEIGIGTGRVSRPLMEQGMRVCGVELAPRMLAKLREQLGARHVRPDLVLSDATQLPVHARSFRVVIAVHILHLVSSLQDAVNEIRRVLAPGGVLLHDRTRPLGDNAWEAIWAKWNDLADRRGFLRRKRPSADEIASALESAGGTRRVHVYAEAVERRTPAYWLDDIRNRTGSQWWQYPDDLFAEIFAEFEPWYRQQYPGMEVEREQRLRHELEVWSFD